MLKTEVQKIDVDFFYCNSEPGSPFWPRWHGFVVKMRCKNAPFEPQFSLQGAFQGKIGFFGFQIGHAKQLKKPSF